MFSSKSKDIDATASATQARRPARSAAPSIISADLVVQGTLTSTGDIQIDGRVEGDVRSAGLVIGDKAFIQGEILADDVTVRGRVQGGIRARKVLLCTTSHVEGNILHEAFAVEAGAFFEGNCRHSDNPLSEDASRQGQSYQNKPASIPAAASAPAPVAAAAPINTIKAPDASVAAPRPAPAATFQPLKSNG